MDGLKGAPALSKTGSCKGDVEWDSTEEAVGGLLLEAIVVFPDERSALWEELVGGVNG
jgi:hypothetical protein